MLAYWNYRGKLLEKDGFASIKSLRSKAVFFTKHNNVYIVKHVSLLEIPGQAFGKGWFWQNKVIKKLSCLSYKLNYCVTIKRVSLMELPGQAFGKG
jgi:hypothetical protein